MVMMTVSMPDPMKNQVEDQFTIDELRSLVTYAKASGVSTRSVEDIFTQAKETARARDTLREGCSACP